MSRAVQYTEEEMAYFRKFLEEHAGKLENHETRSEELRKHVEGKGHHGQLFAGGILVMIGILLITSEKIDNSVFWGVMVILVGVIVGLHAHYNNQLKLSKLETDVRRASNMVSDHDLLYNYSRDRRNRKRRINKQD